MSACVKACTMASVQLELMMIGATTVAVLVPVPGVKVTLAPLGIFTVPLMLPLLLVAVRPPELELLVKLPRFKLPVLVMVAPAATVQVPKVRLLASVKDVAPELLVLVTETAPTKSFDALFNVMAAAAVIVVVPVMARGPVCTIPLEVLLLVADKLPPTVVVPKLKVPGFTAAGLPALLVTIRSPVVVTVPKVKPPWSFRLTAAPVADTAPVNSLAVWVKVMLPLPAFKVVVFELAMLIGPVWVMLPLLFRVKLPELVTVPSAKALASVKLMSAAVTVTTPPKSLAALVKVTLPVPALNVLVPATDSAPFWVMALLVLLTARLPEA